MGTKKAKNISKIKKELAAQRLADMIDKKNEYIKIVGQLHVYFAKGNR